MHLHQKYQALLGNVLKNSIWEWFSKVIIWYCLEQKFVSLTCKGLFRHVFLNLFLKIDFYFLI